MYEPGHIDQPAEVPIGGPWKNRPRRPESANRLGPTDFGARDQAYSDPTRKQIPFSNKPFVVDPPDGKIPMQPWVLAKRKEIYDNHYTEKIEFMDPRIRCLQAGVPRAHTPVYYNSYQIVQRPGAVMIIYEWNHMTRIITLDGSRPPLDPRVRLPMGDSRGRWEDNVLVVETDEFQRRHLGARPRRRTERWPARRDSIYRRRHPAQRRVPGRGTLCSGRRRHHPVRGDHLRSENVHTPVDDLVRRDGAWPPGPSDLRVRCHEGNRGGMLLMTGFDIDSSQGKKYK